MTSRPMTDVMGRAVQQAQRPMERRDPSTRGACSGQAEFSVAEQRRLAAIRRDLFFKELVKFLALVVCVTLWVVLALVVRVTCF